jgi:hypothetical protein
VELVVAKVGGEIIDLVERARDELAVLAIDDAQRFGPCANDRGDRPCASLANARAARPRPVEAGGSAQNAIRTVRRPMAMR